MGKRIFNLWSDITSFEQLRASTRLAKNGIRLNRSALSFLVELDSNIIELQQRLQDQTYQPAPYTEFMLLDPKPRRIQAADFVDRVVHHSLCKSLTLHFERSYLAYSFACQKGKGNHKAIQQAQRFSRRFSEGWFLKIDIKHCFETIDHTVLMKRISKRIGCVDTLWLTEKIISHGGVDGKGLPIGNLTSQHFANFYLDALDHYCVEQLKVQGFIRYMDDVLLFSQDKDHLIEILGELTLWLPHALQLEIKHTATQMHPVHHGIPFLGFRIFPQCIRFDSSRKRRFIQRWKSIAKMNEEEQSQRYNGLICWSEQANTRQLRRHLLQSDRLQS
jgi:hypothetical protein